MAAFLCSRVMAGRWAFALAMIPIVLFGLVLIGLMFLAYGPGWMRADPE